MRSGSTGGTVSLTFPQRYDLLSASAGGIPGVSVVRKFGRNSACGATFEDIWTGGGTYPFPTASTAVRVAAGGNVADTAAGAGAQSVTIVGLDDSWAEASETVATAGAGASAATTTKFVRVFRAYIANVGAYGAANTGAITIENSGGGTTLCVIEAGIGQTQMAIYTIPSGKTGYLARKYVVVESGRAANTRFWRRQNADDTTGPSYAGKRLIEQHDNLAGTIDRRYECMPSLPARTDVWASAQRVGGVDAAVSVQFDIFLVDD